MKRGPFMHFGKPGTRALFLGALVLLLAANGARGQSALTSLSWDPSFPAGQTKDFIGKATWRSFGMDVKGFLTPQFTMGASFDWRLLNEVTDKIIEIEDGHASGSQTRRIYAIPLLLTSHYYLRSFKNYPRYIPYVGAGAGAYWIEEKLEIGVYTLQEKAWNFGLCVELGTLFQFSYGYALLRLKYNYAFESDDVAPVSWWSVGIGLLDTH
jgi:opacity protein-like surface antigen